jgi:hypothetical protein
MKIIKIIVIFIKDLLKARKNPTYTGTGSSYQLMRLLFLISDGLVLNFISKFLKKKNNPKFFNNSYKIMPHIKLDEINEIKEEILKMKISLHKNETTTIKFDINNNIDFDYYKNEKIVRLNILSKDIISNHKVISFLIKNINFDTLKKIIGSDLYLVGVNCWITLPVPNIKENYEQSAIYEDTQIWHRDVDNLRDIKHMIYLTDVLDETSGSFEIVKNTHFFSWFNPFNYFNKFKFRVRDDFVKKKYFHRIFSFLGQAGTNFLVDTRALHRGKIITKQKHFRIVLQLYLSNHFFGNNKKILLDKKFDSYELLKNDKYFLPMLLTE